MTVRVLDGDCLAVMPTLNANSVDAVVTDPPYGLNFMGKAWDHGVPGSEFWTATARVAKPGAYLVAFGGTRTFHRLTCAIEDAGWEIRDCLSWLYGSGFPKSHNGAWGGTALKPAWEPIVLARKPLIGTVAANHAEHGTAGLNIDGCRIAGTVQKAAGSPGFGGDRSDGYAIGTGREYTSGRWPANVVLDESAALELNSQAPDAGSSMGASVTEQTYTAANRKVFGTDKREAAVFGYDERGGASRFFYTAKAARRERDAGLDHLGVAVTPRYGNGIGEGPNKTAQRNHHPTVKPLDLMQWLCRLVTPKGGLILDPFCGSGSTGRAAIAEGFSFVGIELNAEYAEIARARIAEYAPLFGDVA